MAGIVSGNGNQFQPWMAGLSQYGNNPLSNANQVDPTYAYGINANVYNQAMGNQAQMASSAMQAQAQYGAALAQAQSNLAQQQYAGNTQFNVADLQNAGQNWRTQQTLENALKLAGVNNESAQKIAGMQYGSQNYGYDQQLAGQKVAADANRYGSLAQMLQGLGSSNMAANASQYGSLANLLGSRDQTQMQGQLGLQNNLTSLGNTRMQADAQMAPTQLASRKFDAIFPLLEQIFQRALPGLGMGSSQAAPAAQAPPPQMPLSAMNFIPRRA